MIKTAQRGYWHYVFFLCITALSPDRNHWKTLTDNFSLKTIMNPCQAVLYCSAKLHPKRVTCWLPSSFQPLICRILYVSHHQTQTLITNRYRELLLEDWLQRQNDNRLKYAACILEGQWLIYKMTPYKSSFFIGWHLIKAVDCPVVFFRDRQDEPFDLISSSNQLHLGQQSLQALCTIQVLFIFYVNKHILLAGPWRNMKDGLWWLPHFMISLWPIGFRTWTYDKNYPK